MIQRIEDFLFKVYSFRKWAFYLLIVSPPIIASVVTLLFFLFNAGEVGFGPGAIFLATLLSIVLYVTNIEVPRLYKIETELSVMEYAVDTDTLRVGELVTGLLVGDDAFDYSWPGFFEDEMYFERYGLRFAALLQKLNAGFDKFDDGRRVSLYAAILSTYQWVGNDPDAVGEWVRLLDNVVTSMKPLMQTRRQKIREDKGKLTLKTYFETSLFRYDSALLESSDVDSIIMDIMRDSRDGVLCELLADFWQSGNKNMLLRFGKLADQSRTAAKG